MKVNIISIDPHHSRDYAFIIMTDGRVNINGFAPLREIDALIEGCDEGVVEGQYFGINAATVIKLAASRGKVEGIFELRNKPYKVVQPSTWMRFHGLFEPKHKKQTIERVRQMLGADKVDIAHCYLMYLWYVKTPLDKEAVGEK